MLKSRRTDRSLSPSFLSNPPLPSLPFLPAATTTGETIYASTDENAERRHSGAPAVNAASPAGVNGTTRRASFRKMERFVPLLVLGCLCVSRVTAGKFLCICVQTAGDFCAFWNGGSPSGIIVVIQFF